MPNWCSDKLTIIGPKVDVQAFKAKAVGPSPWEEPEGEPDALNFHSLVPIPEEVLKAGYESTLALIGRGQTGAANGELLIRRFRTSGIVMWNTGSTPPGRHPRSSSKPWLCSGRRWCLSWSMKNLARATKVWPNSRASFTKTTA